MSHKTSKGGDCQELRGHAAADMNMEISLWETSQKELTKLRLRLFFDSNVARMKRDAGNGRAPQETNGFVRKTVKSTEVTTITARWIVRSLRNTPQNGWKQQHPSLDQIVPRPCAKSILNSTNIIAPAESNDFRHQVLGVLFPESIAYIAQDSPNQRWATLFFFS